MDIVEIRRENLRRWTDVNGIPQKERSLFSQLRGSGSFGEKVARRLEEQYGMGHLYLDIPASDEGRPSVEPTPALPDEITSDPDFSSLPYLSGVRRVSVGEDEHGQVPIKRVNLKLQAGFPGFEADQNFEDGGTMNVPLNWIEENGLVPQCLLAIKVRGESMEPLFFEDDVVVINIADTKPVSNEIYAINHDGKPVVKQLVYESGDWWLYSMNRKPEFARRICRGGECIIVGKVVYQGPRSLRGRL